MDRQWEQVAQRLWLSSKPTADADLLHREIWVPLEATNFSPQSLLPLEDLSIVEQYLWPTFSKDSNNHHVILIAAFVRAKCQARLPAWPIFRDNTQEFVHLFNRVLSLSLDLSLSIASRLVLLEFVINAFQSLEQEHVRKECAPLVSIATWHNLHSEAYRNKQLEKSSQRQKAWRVTQKRYNNADATDQIRMKFERAWLYSLTLDFLQRLHGTRNTSLELVYCERFLEFLTDLISQLPTRRYSIVLLRDLNVLSHLHISKVYKQDGNALLRDLTELYKHFLDFPVDDVGSTSGDAQSARRQHYDALSRLQRIAFQNFEQKLKVLSLSNFGAIDRPGELQVHLSALTDIELQDMCQLLDIRTEYPTSSGVPTGRALFLDVLVAEYARPRDFRSVVQNLPILPTEQTVYDPTLLRNEVYDGIQPLALPKLNLQYLSFDDFMWRSFQLFQTEALYEIRKDMESTVRRMKPSTGRQGDAVHFQGFSKMALAIDKPAVIEVGPPSVGATYPSFVRAEVILDMGKLNDRARQEWENLRPKDVVFLLAANPAERSKAFSNGSNVATPGDVSDVGALRCAEVVQMLDDSGKPLRGMQANGYGGRSRKRRLLLNIDPVAFHDDQARLSKSKVDVWSSINVLVRRQGRENNFRSVLETIQRLVRTQTELPSWLQETFLGYGDPTRASTSHRDIASVDYCDTFLNWQHLHECLLGQIVFSDSQSVLDPPYVLEPVESTTPPTNPRKRRRDQAEDGQSYQHQFRVSSYKPRNTGPYLQSTRKGNHIQFTPMQANAIMSGVRPGLTIIVGPPGTGKTDVATQIIDLLYQNYPTERILLIAHSNQALNQLFQKIVDRNIDARHLLRLGHGEEELDTEVSYSKYGRVESFMENRDACLGEVNRLAQSIGVEGAHGSTCETAEYFNRVYIEPAWAKFWALMEVSSAMPDIVVQQFPFSAYFANAPVADLFPPTASMAEVKEIAQGCNFHINKIFQELESIRPFEIIRNPRDQANHLLVKEARVIAMTSTHAAMRRSEIADLGFRYDTLIMEEAAQITEVGSFIPCAMQHPDKKTSELPLKRVVLIGDHLQNSPVVQNLALRQYANFEQSLFQRLVRLGVPTVMLDQQGRCRPSIAKLFSWRYENLTNLPHLASLPEFINANAGFRHEYQFIDVPDYQGQGEREPTPHFIQNLGEAEYAVALFQYMRLLGYPAKSISILVTYAGQKALIRDVLDHRCKGNRLFGLPKIVTTVDKYQGEQNDYVILSMVRTRGVGYLRDVRRLTVALSRARLGLYILGRKALFEACPEMKTAMEILSSHGNGKLELVIDEMFPTQRQIDVEAAGVEMDGVEHLGQYVYEMTQAKIKAMGGIVALDISDNNADGNIDAEGPADEDEREADMEDDALHEDV